MASYTQHHQMAPRPAQQRQAGHGPHAAAPAAAAAAAAPPGTFSPGTKIQVGSHRVVIQKYLSEGGFAHVYLVKIPKPVDGTDLAVLKRVAVPDKDALRNMRTEVETMKRLKGHRPIVTYIDSHASEMRGGGYEVFLLMEYCNGGGLIDFMNTRLQHRLTEPEIISIFTDIAEGVACMHYLKPPLLHRDLKVENVLITSRGSSKRFKLCDFGSAAPPRPAPTTVVECRSMDDDVQKHTTLQYRSPEMIDVYRKQSLNEKSDIWALGVLLYKLCYYTTPFEDQGQLAILNASFRYPSHPIFSDRIKKLVASMLRERMEARPTIFQVLKEACAMQGREVPVKDIYAGRPQTESRSNDRSSADPKPPPKVGAVFSAPVREQKRIPEVVPMRRGRPAPAQGATKSPQIPSSPPKKMTEGDPFAALDSKDGRQLESDELSSRFPTLDQFSLLHDKGNKFDFDSAATSPPTEAPTSDMGQGVAGRLADAAFASPEKSPVAPSPPRGSRNVSAGSDKAPVPAAAGVRSRTGQHRAQPTTSGNTELRAVALPTSSTYVSTGTMTNQDSTEPFPRRTDQGSRRPVSGILSPPAHPAPARRPSLSSRPSLEDTRPLASTADFPPRAEASTSRPRPASSSFEPSTVEFLREKESRKGQSRSARPLSRGSQRRSSSSLNAATARPDDSTQTSIISADLIDVGDPGSAAAERPGDSKLANMASLSGPKKKLAGKFGDAFKRFEGGDHHELTPIAGSEATDGRSDDGLVDLSDDKSTPEMRRELERRQLEEEERRVAAAQAEYKRRVSSDGTGTRPVPGPKKGPGVSRAAAIQSRVQSLLEDEQRPSAVQRTAEGYGKYSDAATAATRDRSMPPLPRKPSGGPSPPRAAQATIPLKATGGRPAAPKKPVHLNSLPTGARPPSPAKRGQAPQPELLMAPELPGQPVLEMSAREKDDYIKEFSKRFPSLNSMELDAMSRGR